MRLRLLAALALFAVPAAVSAQPRDPAMDAAVRDLCHRQVAMLGEASHGDGATFAFKAALIRRLVTECGYTAVLFESSHYDFVELMRRMRAGEPVTPAMLSSSIGGVWNRYAELAPLLGFLFDEARAGRLTLGGLDDQLGSAGAFFSLDEMPARLTALLSDELREGCRRILNQRIYEGAASRLALTVCVGGISLLARDEDSRELAANMMRLFEREGERADSAAGMRGRDHSMFLNLRWYVQRLGPRAKIVVWAQNAHIARDATAYSGFSQGGNFGSYVGRAYGRRAFALGFSAYGGSWQRLGAMQEARSIPAAPPGSLEARAFEGSESGADSVYRNADWLSRLGRIPGRLYHYEFAEFAWARAFDGMVIFRAERPPAPGP
jgi:erythromycin esterase-like protein